MNMFQQKQTSLYKPGMELNPDTSSLKHHFSHIAITAAKEIFLKSSMLAAPQPNPLLIRDSSVEQHPNPPEGLWHDHSTTQATVEKKGLDGTTTDMKGANTFADLPTVNSPNISITTLLPVSFSKPTQSTISGNNNDQSNVSSKFLNQISSTHKVEGKKEISTRTHHENPVTPLQDHGVSTRTKSNTILPTIDSSATKTPPPETLRIPFEASTDEDISKSLQIIEEVNTALSPTSSLDIPLSKHEPLTSKKFMATLPPIPGIPDGELWSASAPGHDEDSLSRTEMPTAHIPAMHSTPVDSIQNTPVYNNPDQDNATAKLSVMNQTSASTVKHSVTVTTPSTSGFPEFHASKRRPVCPYPPLPAHGTFYFHTIPNPTPFQYKHYIQYACYAGYTLASGDVYSYCLQDGQWSGVTPVCIGKPLDLHNSP